MTQRTSREHLRSWVTGQRTQCLTLSSKIKAVEQNHQQSILSMSCSIQMMVLPPELMMRLISMGDTIAKRQAQVLGILVSKGITNVQFKQIYHVYIALNENYEATVLLCGLHAHKALFFILFLLSGCVVSLCEQAQVQQYSDLQNHSCEEQHEMCCNHNRLS